MATLQLTNSFQPTNFYESALTSDVGASDTDIFLDSVPTNSEGTLVIDPDSAANREIIYYNSKSATKVTVPSVALGRGYDNTTATTHTAGTRVIMAPIADWFNSMRTLFTTTGQGWTATGVNCSAAAANGNRSYDLTFASTMASILSPGMRLRTTRTVAAPSQSTSLNGTTQYYSKSSPAGMTFTDDFVVSAWIKLTSYGAVSAIASRYNGTSGWTLRVDTDGTVQLLGYNANVANYSRVKSYQSVPLNKWVHVSAQLDMSTFTATTTTSYVMIDGVDVPAAVDRGGTNPTALVQAGDLQIGATNGAGFFSGKIAQVAIYNAKVTQATILASMHQTLSGSETSLISAYSFNNTINDLNANANNLTANGSAVATNADSPFGGQADGTISATLDYGIVQKVATTTVTVQVPEGCTIPTTGGVTSVSYSTQKAPYGMPVNTGKWELETLINNITSTSGTTTSTVYNPGGLTLLRPIGDWIIYGRLAWAFTFTTTTADAYCGLSSSPTVFIQGETGGEIRDYSGGWSSAPLRIINTTHYIPSSGSTTQNYYPLMYANSAVSAMNVRGVITSANAYEYSRIWCVPANL